MTREEAVQKALDLLNRAEKCDSPSYEAELLVAKAHAYAALAAVLPTKAEAPGRPW